MSRFGFTGGLPPLVGTIAGAILTRPVENRAPNPLPTQIPPRDKDFVEEKWPGSNRAVRVWSLYNRDGNREASNFSSHRNGNARSHVAASDVTGSPLSEVTIGS